MTVLQSVIQTPAEAPQKKSPGIHNQGAGIVRMFRLALVKRGLLQETGRQPPQHSVTQERIENE